MKSHFPASWFHLALRFLSEIMAVSYIAGRIHSPNTASPVAQLVECPPANREVVGSNPGAWHLLLCVLFSLEHFFVGKSTGWVRVIENKT
jgi:hypothetical protein